jgi:transcriptional regulator with XRE-family HTH domain
MAKSTQFGLEVGAKVRHFRQEKNFSQEQLAFLSGLNTNSIGMIERGHKSPTIFTLKRICDSLDITLATLFLYKNGLPADNGASIQKVTDLLRQIPSADADRIARIVEQAVNIGK